MGTLSNIKVEPCNVSWNGTDIGFIEGDLEIAFEEQSVDITAHQEGSNVLDSVRTGKSVSLSTALKESALTQLTTLLEAGGATSTAVAEVYTITCVADVTNSLDGKYFVARTQGDAILHHVWFNTSGGSAVDPAPAGSTAVEVAVTTNATATTNAASVASAMDALPGYIATSSGAVVTVTLATAGFATDASTGTSTFTFAVTTKGTGALPGWGNSKDFTGMVNQAKALILHPVVLAASDKSRDLNFWLAYPMLESVSFSGESPEMINISWKIFPDTTRPAAIRLLGYGNGT